MSEQRRTRTVDEVTQILGVCRTTVYELIGTGELRTITLRGRRLVPLEAIEALLAGGAGNTSRPRKPGRPRQATGQKAAA